MPKRVTEINLQIRKEVAVNFKKIIQEKYRGNKAEAARSLGITRQRLQTYLDADCTPGSDVLALAQELWGIQLSLFNMKLSHGQLRKRRAFVEFKQPVQLKLFETPQVLKSRNVEGQVRRKNSKTLSLELQITIAE